MTASAGTPRFDIIGIGNAIVDVQAPVSETFLARHAMQKGGMALIDALRAEEITAALPQGVQTSGGSAANTCAVAAALGAKVAFLGQVAADALGVAFRDDITAAGVHYPTPPLAAGAPTARCLIAVTPDGQRTMNTYLGACTAFGPEEVDETLVADSAVTYLEGYLFDPPAAQEAFRKASAAAHAAGRKVALSLSDSFCVDRHFAEFRALVAGHVDILFANEAEICALARRERIEDAAAVVQDDVELAVLTRGEAGSLVLGRGERHAIAAEPASVVDTTGAGDAYAAGFLAAYAAGRPLEACARLGGIAAAEVISHFGARPQRDLSGALAALPGQGSKSEGAPR